MAKPHDDAAKRMAKQTGGTYNPRNSPDVRGGTRVVEVKSTAEEIPTALDQLKKPKAPPYIALPAKEHADALDALQGTGVGLMDYRGHIVKRARRG